MEKIYIAQGVGVPPLNITGSDPLTKFDFNGESWEQQAQARFDEQSKIIADALFASLPGGTLHALLVEFLRRKTSLLVVNY